MIRHLGIGGRLALAFALIAAITLLAAGLARRTTTGLEQQLDILRNADISVLTTAALLNDTSRQIVATLPLVVAAESAYNRREAKQDLDRALGSMDRLMGDLPDYDNYFREISSQIGNSVSLLNQAVERRETLAAQGYRTRQLFYPMYQRLIALLEQQQQLDPQGETWAQILRHTGYLSGLAEKIATDSSFNELDYTFLRLEELSDGIRARLSESAVPAPPAQLNQQLDQLLRLVSREGELFQLKNDELDLRYQESYLLKISQNHIRQLATQIGQYTQQVNRNIDLEIEQISAAMQRSSLLTLILSLISLGLAVAVSWLYVRKNVLSRIHHLQLCMRAIASGQLDTRVAIRGQDEVAAMARDLQHFQQTALKEAQAQQRLQTEIHERLVAEQQLRKTQQELIQAGKLAALGQLSVAITHEINQPLTAISSHLHSAGLWLDRQRPDRVHNSLSRIRALLDKTANITRHLKGFARKADSTTAPVKLLPVIEAATELVAPRAARCAISISCTPEQQVCAEPIRLEQVLVNLLSNALDAVADTAQPSIQINCRDDDTQTIVEVTDNGQGIDADQLDQIFDPYYTNKAPGAGLGMGLAISYNIMQDFNGQISVRSQPGKGSCFRLQLNRAKEEQHADSAH